MTTPKLAEAVKGKGRHYRHPETGTLVPSVTNVVGILDKPALPRWAAKVVAEQAWALRGSLDNLDEAEAIDLLKASPWRSSTRSANRGTSVHDLLDRRSRGQDGFELEGEAAGYVAGVDAFLRDHDVVPWQTEVTMFGDGYAGTADFIGLLDGVPVLLDYKTGKNGPYPEVALQVAALAACDHWVVDGEIDWVPAIDEGVAVLIKPGGKYVVKRVADLDGAYDAFRSLLGAWHWHRGDAVKLDDWYAPLDAAGAGDVGRQGEIGDDAAGDGDSSTDVVVGDAVVRFAE